MLSNIGPGTLILIIIVALLLFGPSKLPELGRAFGRTLREFKKGASEIMNDEDADRKEVNPGHADASRQLPGQSGRNDQDNKRLPD